MTKIALIDDVCDPRQPRTTGRSDRVWGMAEELVRPGDEAHGIAPYAVPEAAANGVKVHTIAIPPLGYRNDVFVCKNVTRA